MKRLRAVTAPVPADEKLVDPCPGLTGFRLVLCQVLHAGKIY